MSIDFSGLPQPEPSGLTGFGQNAIVRDSEHRSDECLAEAIAEPTCRAFLFCPDKVVIEHGATPRALFRLEEAVTLGANLHSAVLLGRQDGEARLAVPIGIAADELAEPLKAHDFRSLLYGGLAADDEASAIAQGGSLIHWHSVNRHCGRCGERSIAALGGYRRDCVQCGLNIFPRTDPVVIMLAVRGEACLLGRSKNFPPGWYSTLAGFVEPGETIEAAVRRETFEESGIRIGRVKYHASQPWPFPQSLMIGAFGEALNEEVLIDDAELDDCRWFSRDELRSMVEDRHPQGLRCPPRRAIAWTLISQWMEGR